ncbi:amino acid ABC transporter permease [Kushneria aurantia]|uniref:Amino acid ABC transporter permease n=1 Tax=Kushneria aurantia TaxID=504092 RepID=A0ABV6G1I8_9GAMM|nr:amino acid ABC transporter permease [Kushneria aurantia]
MDFSVLTDHLPEIAHGFLITLLSWFGGIMLGAILGLLIAIIQLGAGRWVRAGLRVYIEIVRATPFLVQLFLLYYGGPALGLRLSPMAAGLIGLGIYGSVYFAEIFRTGFLSVPRGQIEAAHMLGMSPRTVIRRIQLPQMMVLILPALTNFTIVLGKETPILSIITVPELTFVLTGIGSETFAYVETLLALCVGYYLMAEFCSRLGQRLESRMGRYLGQQSSGISSERNTAGART